MIKKILVILIIVNSFCSCNEKKNDLEYDDCVFDVDEVEDVSEEPCCSDADFESWDHIIDIGQVDHVSRIIPYKNGYLLSGVIDFPYEPNSDLYLPGYVAFMNKDYSFNWQVLVDRFLIGSAAINDVGKIYLGGNIPDSYSMALVSIDDKGNILWKKRWTDENFFTPGPQGLSTIKFSNGYLYLGGFSGGWNEDGSMTYHKLYFAKADLEGNIVWKKVWGAEGHNYVFDIEVDKEGYIYLTGNTMGSLDGNKNASKNGDCESDIAGCADPFLIKTDRDGNILWTKQWGSGYSTASESGKQIIIDGEKMIFVLSKIKLYGGIKLVLRKYNETGKMLWESVFKETERDINYEFYSNIIIDKNGNIAVSGVIMMDDLNYYSSSQSDIFIASFDKENGNLIGDKTILSPEKTEIYGLQEIEKGFLLMGQEISFSDDLETVYTDTFFKEIGYFYLDPKPDLAVTKGAESVRETVQIGSQKDDEVVFSFTDSDGNLFVAGNSWGSIGGIKNKGEKDVFVAKYKADRTLEWTKYFGSDKWDYLTTAQIDSDGNLILSGTTWGDFEENQWLGVGDIFVMKIDKTGKKLWAETAGSDNDDWVNGLWIESSGSIYLTGGTLGSIDDNKFSEGFGSGDMFVGKWDKNGNKILIEQWGQRIEGFGISGDNNGNIYVTGKVYWNYGDLAVYEQGVPDSIILKLDVNLEEQWARIWGSEEIDSATGIAVDSAGDIFVTGYTFGPIDGNIHLGADCPGGFCPDAYLTKWDSTGKKKWTRQFGTENGDRATSIVIDEKDNIYISGTAGKNRLCEIESDIFLMKSDTSGNLDEIKIWGTAGEESVNSINISNGKIIISGFTTGGLDNSENKGGKDGFVTVIEK